VSAVRGAASPKRAVRGRGDELGELCRSRARKEEIDGRTTHHGRASITELTRYVGILMSSGSDWTDRMRRLAARAPKLEIFANAFVLRDDRGWRISESGRQFLASLEASIPARAEEQEQPSGACVTVVTAPIQIQPTLRLVVDNTRTSQSGLGPDETRRSA